MSEDLKNNINYFQFSRSKNFETYIHSYSKNIRLKPLQPVLP